MNSKEVRNAISILEQALENGLLDNSDTNDKILKLSEKIKSKKSKKIFESSSKTEPSSVSSVSSVKVEVEYVSNTDSDTMTFNLVPSEYFIETDKSNKSNNEKSKKTSLCELDESDESNESFYSSHMKSYHNLAISQEKIHGLLYSTCSNDSEEIINLK
jgi:hypothetical protein